MKGAIQVEGVNLMPDKITDLGRCNIHCPDVGTPGDNFWKERCELRQRDPHQRSCYGGCIYLKTKKKDLPPHAKRGQQKRMPDKILKAIISLHNKGFSQKATADLLEISGFTVSRTVKKWKAGELEFLTDKGEKK